MFLALALFGYRMIRGSSEGVELTNEQLEQAPQDWAQATTGPSIAQVKISANTTTIYWPGQAAASAYRVQTSYDGDVWSKPITLVLQEDGFVQTFEFDGRASPSLYLIEAVSARGQVIARQFENAMHGTGFDQFPRFSKTPGSIMVTIFPSALSGSRTPTEFELELVGGDSNGGNLGNTTSQTAFVVPIPPGSSPVAVRVRAVFPAGDTGPWFGVSL